MDMKIGKPTYSIGDLVRVLPTTYYYLDSADTFPGGIGLIIGKTDSWYEAFEESKQEADDTVTHYWDNVNYSPYKVLMCGSHDKEWVSPEHLEPAY
jgi:hypothetical protein